MIGRRRSRGAATHATLMDVAHAAGVSIASASRALARPELVSEDLLQRVLTSARELGYFPGASRGTDVSAHCRFGAVIADLDDAVLVAGLAAMTKAMRREGETLLVACAGADPDRAARSVHELIARGMQAIAFFGMAVPTSLDASPVSGMARFASFDSAAHDAAPASGYLYAEAIALAVLYLGESGHRRVALAGVRDAIRVRELCRQRGGGALALDTVRHDPEADGFAAASLRAWTADSAHATAVVCGSDRAAGALLQACERGGIAVPGRLSVIGYGDSDLCRAGHPSLSSLRVPTAQAGEALAGAFLANPAHRPATALKLSAKLILRESTRSLMPSRGST